MLNHLGVISVLVFLAAPLAGQEGDGGNLIPPPQSSSFAVEPASDTAADSAVAQDSDNPATPDPNATQGFRIDGVEGDDVTDADVLSEGDLEPALEELPVENGTMADDDLSLGAPDRAAGFGSRGTASSRRSFGDDGPSSELLPSGLDGRFDGEGLVLQLDALLGYDSNLFVDDENEVDDFSVVAAPGFTYSSAPPGGAETILNAAYTVYGRAYFDNSDLNAFDQRGQASLTYTSPVASLSARVALSEITEADRFSNDRRQNSIFTVLLGGDYEVSQKTSLAAKLGYGEFSDDQGSLSENETFLASVTGFWEFSPLLKVGPAIRYAHSDSENIGETESLAFLVAAEYELSGLLDLSASAGLEQVDRQDASRGADDGTNFTGSFAVNYRSPDLPWSGTAEVRYESVSQIDSLSSRGGGAGDNRLSASLQGEYAVAENTDLGLSFEYRTIPSPSENNVSIDDLAVTLQVRHDFGLSSLAAGAVATFSTVNDEGGQANPRDDQQTWGVFAAHRMRFLADSLSLNNSIRYSSSTGERDWDRFQVTTGLGYVF